MFSERLCRGLSTLFGIGAAVGGAIGLYGVKKLVDENKKLSGRLNSRTSNVWTYHTYDREEQFTKRPHN